MFSEADREISPPAQAHLRYLSLTQPALVSYGMILSALLLFLVEGAALPAWRFYTTVGALLALLALNLLDLRGPTLPQQDPKPAVWLFLLISAALFLTAFVLGTWNSFSLIPFLLFLLIGQAVWSLPLRQALSYTLVLLAGSFVATYLHDGLRTAAFQTLSFTAGTLFTVIFSLLTVRYGEQTARAEALLRQLQQANAELEAARVRERQLAAAEERVRLARDIHDGLGHHLTVLSVQLQAAARLIERDPARTAEIIAVCREETQAALADVRQSVGAMRNTPLDGGGLDEALEALAQGFARHSSASVRFCQRGDPAPLSPAAALTLYRVAQEGLTNAQKHAGASLIVVELRYEGGLAALRVEDDGQGPSGDVAGFGLAGLRERAEQLGGRFSAGSRPEGGFALEITVPSGEF
ncbi:MAG TPA: sensor histidine kinase [Roseiflexaceae bacterium]|nr:sensor histidine kinase [Roseiflexaceae bacterium]